MQSETQYLVATGDTSKTKLHKPLSESDPKTPACKPTAEYRLVSESIGKSIIDATDAVDEKEWKCLRCFFKNKIPHGESVK